VTKVLLRLTHIVTSHDHSLNYFSGGVHLEYAGHVNSKLTVSAPDVNSAFHKRFSDRVREQNQKIDKAKLGERLKMNPEQNTQHRIKLEEERIRQEEKVYSNSSRVNSSSRYVIAHSFIGLIYSLTYLLTRTRYPSMSSKYLTDNADDYDTINISDIKKGRNNSQKRSVKRGDDGEIESEDEDYSSNDSEMDGFIVKKNEEDEDEEEDEDFDDEDDDDGTSTHSLTYSLTHSLTYFLPCPR